MNHPSSMHPMPFGADVQDGGGVRFRLWAPAAREVVLERRRGEQGAWLGIVMQPQADGWHFLQDDQAAPGDDYRFRLPDGLHVPDPASRSNPQGVHGPSRVVDPKSYAWQCQDWRGRPWHEAVIYELHVGCFTPEGTLASAQARLQALADMGITVIALMPMASFTGQRGWGYDGVLHFAPHPSYGAPDDLKRFVDAAHGLGLMVLADVVYNHFGPDGNYLHAYCPQFFNPAHQTPWGSAINFDGPASHNVREFFIHNALYWIEEFRFDGLRMDAVHAIRDDSPIPIVEAVCAAVRQSAGHERHVHVVLENDANEAHRLVRGEGGLTSIATAQWNDDLHHAAHVLLTGEADGYYVDFADEPLKRFALALSRGFVYAGEPSAFRGGAARGEPCSGLALDAFVSYLQTHDQVGNRAMGERIDALADARLVQAARACVLLSPHTPMLFMGEEWAARTPFYFFCDYAGGPLGDAVREGRRAEFAHFNAFADEAARAAIPDPNAEQTFMASKLDWSQRDQPDHASALAHTRALLAVRQQLDAYRARGSLTIAHGADDGVLWVDWELGGEHPVRLHLRANFGPDACRITRTKGRALHQMGASGLIDLMLESGGVYASLDDADGSDV
ncbi:malto-oligosyltrehalose trehalohydrolase [Variovorax dokdonensis]|uniref:Malto-oligosyltrehalose trehalohydrolase n=1 Tax=Variovorax dokdonensis TaxID=344883 RepID=A0ABT7N617_9BURK|nr:malto-oligosyltrehalose trehalohydrolase [Variovorax dokdonensis]MDM0043365.1 malto-oligosyltrehalose trehalohydrolase [Variovorax dokdonensis]